MKFWNFANKAATETEPESVELRIEGEIVDDDDMWIMEYLGIKATAPNAFKAELDKYNGKLLNLWIDSPGGNIYAATGMYTALQERPGNITAKVMKSMSAATIPQMAADEILMVPTGIVMVHNPLCEAYGYASEFRKIADILDEIKEAIMNAYQLKTGRSRAKLSAMMDAETYMNAKTAIKEGFATGMLYSDQAVEAVEMMFERSAFSKSTKSMMQRMVALYKTPEEDPPPKKPDPPDNKIALARMALEIEI
jgi:ATP-dependent Clp protease protease subunit